MEGLELLDPRVAFAFKLSGREWLFALRWSRIRETLVDGDEGVSLMRGMLRK